MQFTDAMRQEETRQFFCISAELRDPKTSDAQLLDRLAELEAIRMHTPSARLRRRCTELLGLFDLAKTSDKLA